MAEATHLLGLPLKHKPKDIKPQGTGSGLDADKVDGLHASEIGGGGGPHASSHETGGADKVHIADLEHSSGDATLHDALTSAPHISQADKDQIHNRQHALDSALDHTGAITDVQHGSRDAGLHADSHGQFHGDADHNVSYEKVSNKGAAGGYCELDDSVLVPQSRIPNLPASKITSEILAAARGGLAKALSPTWTDDYILVYDGVTDQWIMEAKPSGGGADHNLLSATHPDTLAASVMAGDILYGNATPKWARLAKGTDGQFLKLVSGLPAWADPPAGADHNLLSTTHPDALPASPVAGDLLFANATPKWARLAVGTNDKILKVVNGAPAWADPPVSVMDFWSDISYLVSITGTVADINLPDVVISLPSGATLIRIIAIIMFGAVENTSSSGDNAIYAAYNIRVKKSTGTWGVDDIAAINVVDGEWLTPKLSRESGRVQPGDNDVKSEVDGGGTYNFRFEDTRADYANLNLYDIQMGLRVWFR